MIPLQRTPALHRSCREGEGCRFPNLWRGLVFAVNLAGNPGYASSAQCGRNVSGAQQAGQNVVLNSYGGYAMSNGALSDNWMTLWGPPVALRFLNESRNFSKFTMMVCFVLNTVNTSSGYLASITDYTSSTLISFIGKVGYLTTQFWTTNSIDNAGTNRASANSVTGGITAGTPYCVIGKESLSTRYGFINGPNDSAISYINTGTATGFTSKRASIGRLDRASSPANAPANTYFYTFAFWMRDLTDAEMRVVSSDPMVLFRKNPAREFAFRPNIRGISDFLRRKHSANA